MDGMVMVPPPSVQPPSQQQSVDVVAVPEKYKKMKKPAEE
jgi:hypothetical protein